MSRAGWEGGTGWERPGAGGGGGGGTGGGPSAGGRVVYLSPADLAPFAASAAKNLAHPTGRLKVHATWQHGGSGAVGALPVEISNGVDWVNQAGTYVSATAPVSFPGSGLTLVIQSDGTCFVVNSNPMYHLTICSLSITEEEAS